MLRAKWDNTFRAKWDHDVPLYLYINLRRSRDGSFVLGGRTACVRTYGRTDVPTAVRRIHSVRFGQFLR